MNVKLPCLKMPSTHDLVTIIGALTIPSYIFVHPQTTLDLTEFAWAFAILNGGQGLGVVTREGARYFQNKTAETGAAAA